MVAYETITRSYNLKAHRKNVISFGDGMKITVISSGFKKWQVEKEEGSFSLMWIRDIGNLLNVFGLTLGTFSDSNDCPYDVNKKTFIGKGTFFEFQIVVGDGITSDLNPCYAVCLNPLPTASTKYTIESTAEFHLCFMNIDPGNNRFEYEVKNEKGNFSIICVQCMLSLST